MNIKRGVDNREKPMDAAAPELRNDLPDTYQLMFLPKQSVPAIPNTLRNRGPAAAVARVKQCDYYSSRAD